MIKNIIILAGGDSTRFWPLNNKCLFKFLDKPLIFYIINEVEKYAENLWVVGNKVNKKNFETFFSRKSFKKLNLITQEKLNLGMAGAILACEKKITGEVLILNGSDIFDFSILDSFIIKIKKKHLKLQLLGKKIDEYFPGGYFIFDKKRDLKGILEKPPKEKTPSKYVKLVCDYFFDFKILINKIKKINRKTDDIYEEALNFILSEIKEKDVFLYDGYWLYLKYPWNVLPMMNFYLNKFLKNKILIGKNVKISKTAKVVGPSYIGDNTFIGDFVIIRESYIAKNCLIGGYSEVTRSYLGEGVYLHRNYIGDSILDDKVLIGAGAVLANYRFDEKNIKSLVKEKKLDTGMRKMGAIIGKGSKIGANCTILPGIKIGKNTFVGPGEVVKNDISDNRFIFNNNRKNLAY